MSLLIVERVREGERGRERVREGERGGEREREREREGERGRERESCCSVPLPVSRALTGRGAGPN